MTKKCEYEIDGLCKTTIICQYKTKFKLVDYHVNGVKYDIYGVCEK